MYTHEEVRAIIKFVIEEERRLDAEEKNEPKLCERCPYNPVHALIRNGGEDVCPDAFKPVAVHCNYNYNCQKNNDR